MKRGFEANLRCLACGGSSWTLEVDREDGREVREGRLGCRACSAVHRIEKGIIDALDPNDELLAREVKGWHEMAGPLTNEGIPYVIAFPCFPRAPWLYLGPDFFQVFDHVDFRCRNVVDLGAGRTWSSRFINIQGQARQVVAVDVLRSRLLGLETADLYFDLDDRHFERICGDIHRVPLRDGWADVVFSASSIHHSPDLDRLFTEAWRLLKPGGRLVFVGEPSKMVAIPERIPPNEEVAHGINEHVYTFREYRSALRRVGFRVRHLAPQSVRYRLLYTDPDFQAFLPEIIRRLSRTWPGRSLVMWLVGNRLTAPLVYRYANLPLSIVARKPF